MRNAECDGPLDVGVAIERERERENEWPQRPLAFYGVSVPERKQTKNPKKNSTMQKKNGSAGGFRPEISGESGPWAPSWQWRRFVSSTSSHFDVVVFDRFRRRRLTTTNGSRPAIGLSTNRKKRRKKPTNEGKTVALQRQHPSQPRVSAVFMTFFFLD